MDAKKVKNGILKELTGRDPQENTGMLIGFFFSLTILGGLGGGTYVYNTLAMEEDPSGGGFFLSAFIAIFLGFLVAYAGDRLGWLQSDLEGVAEKLTYDGEDYLADTYGIKSWDYEHEREMEVAAAGCLLASFQFLFGTLWSTFKHFTGGEKLPEEGLRGPTAVAMYLHQAGRTSQAKLTSGLTDSGLPEHEAIKGLAILKKLKLVIGNTDGFLLSERAKELFS